jgi:hypothetical protein
MVKKVTLSRSKNAVGYAAMAEQPCATVCKHRFHMIRAACNFLASPAAHAEMRRQP